MEIHLTTTLHNLKSTSKSTVVIIMTSYINPIIQLCDWNLRLVQYVRMCANKLSVTFSLQAVMVQWSTSRKHSNPLEKIEKIEIYMHHSH